MDIDNLTAALLDAIFAEKSTKIVKSVVPLKKARKIDELLQKNEFAVTAFSDGVIKLDFGKKLSKKIRERVLDWAKRHGLHVAIPLEKNVMIGGITSTILCAPFAINGFLDDKQVTCCYRYSL